MIKHKRLIGIGLSALILVSLCAVCASTGVMAANSSRSTQAAQAKSTDIGAPLVTQLLDGTGPAVTSWAPGRLDGFVVGSDHALWHAYWQNGWSKGENLGGYLTSSPAAVSWGNGRIDIFARGSEGHCWHLWWQDGWGTWEDIGGQLLAGTGPAVSSWAPGHLDLFVVGANDNYLWQKTWTGSSWTNFKPLNGYLTSSPAAVSWGQGRIDVFARGSEGHAWHLWYQNGWGTWEDVGGQLLATTGPAVSSWAPGHLDLFVVGANDNYLWQRTWTGSSWTNFKPLNGYLTSSPAAVSWGQGRIDVFARGSEGDTWHLWYQNGWGTWEDVGAPREPVQLIQTTVTIQPQNTQFFFGRLLDKDGNGIDGKTVTIYYGPTRDNLNGHVDETTSNMGSLGDGYFEGSSPIANYFQATFAGDSTYAASQSVIVAAP